MSHVCQPNASRLKIVTLNVPKMWLRKCEQHAKHYRFGRITGIVLRLESKQTPRPPRHFKPRTVAPRSSETNLTYIDFPALIPFSLRHYKLSKRLSVVPQRNLITSSLSRPREVDVDVGVGGSHSIRINSASSTSEICQYAFSSHPVN